MSTAALITWVLTALLGGFLLLTWISNGGLSDGRPSRFAPPLILGHAGLAATGLGVWVWYFISGASALPWVAVGILVVVASLGATMFGLWFAAGNLPRGRHAHRPHHAAEDHLPPPAVLIHGAFALTTVTLVVITAVRTI